MKRSERIALISTRLFEHPHQRFLLRELAEELGASRSSISEDLEIIKQVFYHTRKGLVETQVGQQGGVMFRPLCSADDVIQTLIELENTLNQKQRAMIGPYIYYGDVLGDPSELSRLAKVFYHLCSDLSFEGIVTIETKPLALSAFLAKLFHVPMIVLRRHNRMSEGSTLSVHYRSENEQVVQSLYMSRGALHAGSNYLILDDYIGTGGTFEGMKKMVFEAQAHVIGAGFFLSSGECENQQEFIHLFEMDRQAQKPIIRRNLRIQEHLRLEYPSLS